MPNRDEQKALLDRLQRSRNPEAQAEASQLEKLYHDRQLGGLAADVYDAAKDEGQPPAGWIRISDRPEMLARYASSLGVSAKDLLDELHPENSGFRAEIYLPDERVLGPGYKPVVAFKGSSGEVMISRGLRETGGEDFIAKFIGFSRCWPCWEPAVLPSLHA